MHEKTEYLSAEIWLLNELKGPRGLQIRQEFGDDEYIEVYMHTTLSISYLPKLSPKRISLVSTSCFPAIAADQSTYCKPRVHFALCRAHALNERLTPS